jgi:hypothetical protein
LGNRTKGREPVALAGGRLKKFTTVGTPGVATADL